MEQPPGFAEGDPSLSCRLHRAKRGAQTSHPCIPAKVFWAHPGQRVWLASSHPGICIPTHYSILASFICNNSASLHPLLRGIPASWHPDCQASSHPRISSQFFLPQLPLENRCGRVSIPTAWVYETVTSQGINRAAGLTAVPVPVLLSVCCLVLPQACWLVTGALEQRITS
jgi:hypothetical protein